MKKNHPVSEPGFFNPRIFGAFLLCSVGAWLAMFSFASTPSSGTLTDTSGPVSYTAGPFFVSNPTPVIELDSGPECGGSSQPCDDFALTVSLPSGFHTSNPNASVKVTLSWTDSGSGSSDYDLYIYKTPRPDCHPNDCTQTGGGEAADYQSASSNNPEIATISPLHDGTQTYTIVVVPFTATGETVHVTAELAPGSGSAGGVPGFGGPDPTAPGVPRYQNFFAPDNTSAQSSAGEFNIGYNPKTGRIMNMNLGPVWRITPPELLTPAKPECCEGLWEDKSNPTTNTGLDPILFTDQKTGRTFASNSTAGANAVYGYSDNDGDLWVPLAASPASGGTDHETIGSGPYPPSLSALSNPVNQGEAVYYCSQSWPLGPATCQRSDTLGASYGPGVLAYEGNGITQCHGLHGHVHVAPNGTVWLPVNQCGGKQGGAVSTDGGTTWSEFIVTGSQSQINGADPSVGIDSNSTAYYCYVNNEPVAPANPPEGHVHIKVSKDGGKTWIRDFDLGASHGIKNAAHTEAIGGSAGRAACGFLGTDVAGDYQSSGFPGKWYAFVATTYNEGQTWVTVNATPNDPVQSKTGIWQQGGSHDDRNLLDFNEITVDDKGRALYGYSDGCVTPGCIAGTAADDFVAFMRVARQSGGKSLFASFDTAEPVAPKPPCLFGTRDPAASHLIWKAPDNGGWPQPLGSSWYVAMKIIKNGTTTYKGVHMSWNGTTPTFESYTPAPNGSGGVDGRFVTAGSQKPAEASSGYAPPFNKVVIVVKASDVGLNPGDTISGFVSGVSQPAGAVSSGIYDQMPDSLAFTGNYTVNSNQVCRPNAPPTAVLTATPTSGTAPLAVKFDGSGSHDPDTAPPPDTIASYTFNFGDRSPAVTQSTPTISHTYTGSGIYPATLTVTDSRGLQSTNPAQVVITVRGKPPKKKKPE